MDTIKYMIIIKGEFKTRQVKYCEFDDKTLKYTIVYNNGREYQYLKENVIFMRDPIILKSQDYLIETQNIIIKAIYEFSHKGVKYWHILSDGLEYDFKKSDLKIKENSLSNVKSKKVFNYLKEISELSELKSDTGNIILRKYYEKMDFIPNDSALSIFLDNTIKLRSRCIQNLIFPFGCNKSQYKAVKNAVENQISIIQGPPGTGKTQTILNIISNLLLNGNSVIVVSNNNSATLNIKEKLSKEEYGFDFMVASLGSSENKKKFIEDQSGKYPNLSSWAKNVDELLTITEISKIGKELQNLYNLQEEMAKEKEKKYQIELEARHFNEFADSILDDCKNIKTRSNITSDKIMKLWIDLQNINNNNRKISIFFKIKTFILYGLYDKKFYEQKMYKIITMIQRIYYEHVIKEMDERLVWLEKELTRISNYSDEYFVKQSLIYFKNFISKKYNYNNDRPIFKEEDLFRNSKMILNEYPIVLSSTFSACTNINIKDTTFDYVIMDEASQVDVATGALALACAKNAIIVGDLKQLPNVVGVETKKKAERIRNNYDIDTAYDYANKSFLQSIIDILPDAKSTLLKEHYRCHPRIIGFCNQKFYNNDLVVMTKDDHSDKTLMIVKTVEGNHERNKYSQRQIDVIKEEILPDLDVPHSEIGIIAPYNNQVNELKKQIPDIDISTVHKFQGREKDTIIISTVDDVIKEFTDDPYLLNVAVSRAKKRLIVVLSGNKQKTIGNISDLVSYIQYNKGEIVNSKLSSIFDYLYSQYEKKRKEYLKSKKKISKYDSENLTYDMLQDILKDYIEYGIGCFQPLYTIIRDLKQLSVKELEYALNTSTHLDFVIFNRLSKQPLFAIEVDGYNYHKEGTKQYERDMMKNHILEVCGLPLVRIHTNGSNEHEIVVRAFKENIGIK